MSTISDDKHFYVFTECKAGNDQRIYINIVYYVTCLLWKQAQKIFSCIAQSYWTPCKNVVNNSLYRFLGSYPYCASDNLRSSFTCVVFINIFFVSLPLYNSHMALGRETKQKPNDD